MLSGSKSTFLAGASFKAGVRLKFVGDGSNTVIPAMAGDNEIGTALLFSAKEFYPVGSSVGLAFPFDSNTRTLLASGQISQGKPLFRADNGAVSMANVGEYFGIALDNANDGEMFEGTYLAGGLPASARKVYIAQGANSTAGPVNIPVAGVQASDRVTEAINVTDQVVLDFTKFTPYAGGFSQAQSLGDLSTKKIQFRTASVPQ